LLTNDSELGKAEMEFDPDNVRIYVEEKERAEWYRHLNALAQVPPIKCTLFVLNGV